MQCKNKKDKEKKKEAKVISEMNEEQKQEEERAKRLAEEKARLKKLYGSEYKHGMMDAKGDFAAEGKDSGGGRSDSGVRGSKDSAPSGTGAAARQRP